MNHAILIPELDTHRLQHHLVTALVGSEQACSFKASKTLSEIGREIGLEQEMARAQQSCNHGKRQIVSRRLSVWQ